MVLTKQNGNVVCFGKVTSNEEFSWDKSRNLWPAIGGLIQVWPAMDKILYWLQSSGPRLTITEEDWLGLMRLISPMSETDI